MRTFTDGLRSLRNCQNGVEVVPEKSLLNTVTQKGGPLWDPPALKNPINRARISGYGPEGPDIDRPFGYEPNDLEAHAQRIPILRQNEDGSRETDKESEDQAADPPQTEKASVT